MTDAHNGGDARGTPTELEREIARLRSALEIIASKTYPATYIGINEYGVDVYGSYDDASNYARRILNGEQVT